MYETMIQGYLNAPHNVGLFIYKNCSVLLQKVKCVAFFVVDGAGANKKTVTDKNTAKLDRETEELHRK